MKVKHKHTVGVLKNNNFIVFMFQAYPSPMWGKPLVFVLCKIHVENKVFQESVAQEFIIGKISLGDVHSDSYCC